MEKALSKHKVKAWKHKWKTVQSLKMITKLIENSKLEKNLRNNHYKVPNTNPWGQIIKYHEISEVPFVPQKSQGIIQTWEEDSPQTTNRYSLKSTQANLRKLRNTRKGFAQFNSRWVQGIQVKIWEWSSLGPMKFQTWPSRVPLQDRAPQWDEKVGRMKLRQRQ